ncbi:procathepsin L-like [Lineus longissimus]|uniref:procathepsin L-like n=1 Tax=Lineus longissimus TaxID=88925 RepID=UPI002B4EF2F9
MKTFVLMLCVASSMALPWYTLEKAQVVQMSQEGPVQTMEQPEMPQPIYKSKWEAFKAKHNKTYTTIAEEIKRFEIFVKNLFIIDKHNELHKKGQKSYTLGVNKYADMEPEEFRKVMNGYKMDPNWSTKSGGATYLSPSFVSVPDTVDWRTKGYVTPVKNQGSCGSCWAFSTTGSLEGQHFKKTGVLMSLSEQNLVDCSESYGNNGCNGGLMDNAFKYIKANGGIDTEVSYPYQAKDKRCRFKKSDVGATDSGFVDLPSGNEIKLKEASATVGPISVAIDAGHTSFQLYHSGVYDEPECSSTALDHGVLMVGYGSSEDGIDYWLVKNSWGVTWGEDGFVKMVRNKDNQCGVATQASYPLV